MFCFFGIYNKKASPWRLGLVKTDFPCLVWLSSHIQYSFTIFSSPVYYTYVSGLTLCYCPKIKTTLGELSSPEPMCEFEEFRFTCNHSVVRLRNYCHSTRSDDLKECFGVKRLTRSWQQAVPCEDCGGPSYDGPPPSVWIAQQASKQEARSQPSTESQNPTSDKTHST